MEFRVTAEKMRCGIAGLANAIRSAILTPRRDAFFGLVHAKIVHICDDLPLVNPALEILQHLRHVAHLFEGGLKIELLPLPHPHESG